MKNFIKKPLSSLSKNLRLWREVIHHRSLIEMTHQRVALACCLVAIAYILVAGRLIDVMVIRSNKNKTTNLVEQNLPSQRRDIVDRNGEVLATQIITASVYANPKVVINARDAADKLASVFPDMDFESLYQKLSNPQKGFIWIARHIAPKTQQAIHKLGIPGVYLQKDFARVYPHGPLLSHVLGYCGLEGTAFAGVERFFDEKLKSNNHDPLKLSLDLRIQHIVYDALAAGVTEFSAQGGNAMVMDIKTGEMLAMVSFPIFDPNQASKENQKNMFNRNTMLVFEPGSTFKIINAAIGLESGTANLQSTYDATNPVKIGRFTVSDFKGKHRVLSLSEAIVYSSNIAAIKIAQGFGSEVQKKYMQHFGFMKPATIEISEIGHPLIPARWSEATTMTASYGYGIAVTPLHVFQTISSIINNGVNVQPSLIYGGKQTDAHNARLVSEKTSKILRDLMRMVAVEGTAKKANIEGYEVIAKTGTAYQAKYGKGGYGTNKTRTNTFFGAFPHNNPKYAIIVMMDDPQPTKNTYGYATAGWNVTPVAGQIIERIAPLLGMIPQYSNTGGDEKMLIEASHQQEEDAE